MSKKISIIISVWNGEKYLAEAIESVLAQDYSDKEIIIVDDGSTDNTAAVIQSFGNCVRSVYQENKGLGAGRNTGRRFATGNYLAFLDCDDLWEKNKLSTQMDFLLSCENDPLVFSQVKQFICPDMPEEEKKKVSVNESILPGYIAGTLLLSCARFQQVGNFIEQNQVGEFIDWYLRALSLNVPIVMLSHLGLFRRVHMTNMGRQQDIYKRTDYLKILKANLDRKRLQENK